MTNETESIMHSTAITVSVFNRTVSISIDCGGRYAASVLYDDLIDRLEAGEEVSITMDPPLDS